MRTYKLVLRNFAKNVKDYLIYFMTLVISISIFYAFHAVVQSDALSSLSSDIKGFMHSISDTFTLLSRMISVLIGFMVLYVNRFLLRRRQKELGIYMLLGMKKHKISMIFVAETFLIGLLSLAAGLTAGTFLAQLLAIASLRVFGGQVNDFSLSFSVQALGNTIFCFGIIYLFTMVFNVFTVSKVTLLELFTAERKNEELKSNKGIVYTLSFVLGIISFVAGGALFRTQELVPGKNQMLWGCVFIMAATLLIFYSAAAVFMQAARRNRKFYFRGINCFLVRQIGSRIRENFVSMSVVCLLLVVTILLLTTGTSIAMTMAGLSKDFTPYDFVLEYEVRENSPEKNPDIIRAAAEYEYPVDLAALIDTSFQIPVKSAPDLTYSDLFAGQEVQLWDMDSSLPEYTVQLLGISDYNECLRAQGYPEIRLDDDAFIVNCNYKGTYQYIKYFADHTDSLSVNGIPLVLKDKDIKKYVYEMTSVSNNDRGTLIVPDAVAENLPADYYVLQGFWKEGTDTDAANAALNTLVEHDLDNTPFGWTSKARIYSMYYLSLGLPVFVLTYLGIIFLLICVALISVQQLTQMQDSSRRFQILKNQGVQGRLMQKSVREQTGIYFGMPLVLAGIYTTAALPAVMDKVSTFFNMEIRTSMIVTLIVLLLIYGGYYVATFASCERMIFHGKE